jgi:hypothetical protein
MNDVSMYVIRSRTQDRAKVESLTGETLILPKLFSTNIREILLKIEDKKRNIENTISHFKKKKK